MLEFENKTPNDCENIDFYFHLALLPCLTLYMLSSIAYASYHVITQMESSSITQNLIWDFGDWQSTGGIGTTIAWIT